MAMARTPFGKFRGALAELDSIDLGHRLIDAVAARDPDGGILPEIVYGGAGLLGGSHLTALRQSLIKSALPDTTPSQGVDRACCSGMTAIASAAAHLRAGQGDKALAIGVESLSNTPVLLHRGSERKINSLELIDPLLLSGSVSEKTIAQYTSEEALKCGVGRAEQDQWALESHEKYFAAKRRGAFDGQIVPLRIGDTVVTDDEGPRETSSLARLAALPTVNGAATITAGNAPGLSDGAAGLVLVGGEDAAPKGALAEIVDWVQLAGDLQSGTSIPAACIARLLERNRLALHDIDVIEINEAFAATPLVSATVMANRLGADPSRLRDRINAWGGSVAIGHPLGASGIRIVMQAIDRLRERGGGIAVCAICGGFGQGEAVLLRL
ncbi:hypothetical protein AWJ14_13760 [Hoeflea olei]|uniref:Acetyl-CoA acetyltransferase n=2 Tax=Hoeflea olei TaxID=1480615 RepID=A0A1C1YYA2_9HYPH|nr:hypothetical protein AWJ14_13760 [Hoeflea olei]